MIKSMTFTSPASGASALTLHESANRKLSKIDGLFGPPAPRDISQPRPGADGQINQTRWLDARTIVLEGELWNTSTSAVLADFQTLSAAFQESLLSPATLKFKRADDTEYQVSVKLADSVQVSLEGGANTLQYQATFTAPDPRIYSTTLQTLTLATTPVSGPATVSGVANIYTLGSTTAVNAVNNGTAPAPLTITLQSTATGSIESGTYVSVLGPLAYQQVAAAASQTLLLGTTAPTYSSISPSAPGVGGQVIYDTGARTRTVTGGFPEYGALAASAGWPVFYPGTSTVYWVAYSRSSMATNKPSCVITWRDAWW